MGERSTRVGSGLILFWRMMFVMQWPQFPDYGCFLRWPENGHGFIHPEDMATVRRLMPSPRVLKRTQFDGTYYHYRYGPLGFRLRPAMWLQVSHEGFDIDDRVETVGVGLERERFVATIWGMYYIQRKGCILYRLRRGDQLVPNLYPADQMRLLESKAKLGPAHTKYRQPKWEKKGPEGGGGG